VLAWLALAAASFGAPPARAGGIWGDLGDDARWLGRTAWYDVRSIVTLPLAITHITEITPTQLLEGAAVMGAIGGTIALDQSIRRQARTIGPQTGRELQSDATIVSWASLGLLYGAGLVGDRDRWRQGALTGGESAVASMGLTKVTKPAFGRQRPDADLGAYRWWDGGTSFVSDAATPHFAIAEAVSDSFDHAWWITLPTYATAAAVGVGRMAQDRHWASDILGSAALGYGTQSLFGFFHEREKKEDEEQGPQREEAPAGGEPQVTIAPQPGGAALAVTMRL